LSDKREAVRYTAAAAVLRLSAIKEAKIKEASAAVKRKALVKKSKKK
jgi:hypothetical protein